MNKAVVFKGDVGDGTIMRLVCKNVKETLDGSSYADLVAEIQKEDSMGESYWEFSPTLTHEASHAEHWVPMVLSEMTSKILKGKGYQ